MLRKVIKVRVRDKGPRPCPMRIQPQIQLREINSTSVNNLNQEPELSIDSLVFKSTT